MSTHKTDYVLLFVITACASLATIFILLKISYEVDTVSPQQETTIMRSESTPLATFNALVAQGWKVYRDEVKNIEFAYPNNWILENGTHDISLSFSNKDNFQKELQVNFSIFEIDNQEKLNLEQWTQENVDLDPTYLLEKKNITLGNISGLYTKYSESKAERLYNTEHYFNSVFIYLINDSSIYTISSVDLASKENLSSIDLLAAQQYETQFNQILSSFHFLK